MYRFLTRLPRHGHFYASVLADEESVAELLSTEDNDKKVEMSLAGWTTDHDLLSTIIDVLNHMHATLVQVNTENGKRPDVRPMQRPGTAIERVEARQALEEHRKRVAQWTPGR